MKEITEETIEDMDDEILCEEMSPEEENIPLDVREHLMRGQYNTAVSALEDDYGFDKNGAETLIKNYRQGLRERKIALDIVIMHEQQEKEAKGNTQVIWRWSGRILLFVICLALLYTLAELIAKTPKL